MEDEYTLKIKLYNIKIQNVIMFVTTLENKRNILYLCQCTSVSEILKNVHKLLKGDGDQTDLQSKPIIKQSKVAITKSELIPVIADQPMNIILFLVATFS